MCGRFVQSKIGSLLEDELEARLVDETPLRASWNIPPGARVPILLEQADDDGALERQIIAARWGLLKPWNKEQREAFQWRTHNAQAETAGQKRTWKGPLTSRRCAVPAEAYYEWEKITEKDKRPYAIRPADGSMILFAGLWETWKQPEDEQLIVTFTILTGATPDENAGGVLGELGRIHHRMPLAMSSEMASEWMNPVKLSEDAAQELLKRVYAGAYEVARGWEVQEVSNAVNTVANDSPELLDPVEPEVLF